MLLADIRYALRLLRKAPGFSIVAILTMALGIGANAAMFSVVDVVLIRPLPYQDADQLVMVWEDYTKIGFPRNTPSAANWQEWRRLNTVFTDIAATRGESYILSGDGEPQQLVGRKVTASFWNVLGSQPMLGRVFTQDEDDKHERVAVISYGLWQRQFGAARDIEGRKILLDDQPFTVIGVMPRDFYFYPSRRMDIWTPTSFTPQELAWRGSHYLNLVARLKPGVTVEQAAAAMTTLGSHLVKQNRGSEAMPVIVPLREQLAGKTRTSLMVLICASAAVLVICCANLANLLLARGASRQREVAVRSALGAGRGRLVTQFLTESLVLSTLGAIAGLALARPAMSFLETLVPTTMVAMHLTLDWRVLAFSTAIAIGAGVAFGLVPALGGTRAAIQESLKEGSRGVAGPSRHWFQNSLIVAETALAIVLLTGGGLLLQTLQSLHQVDLGIRTEKLLTLITPLQRYSEFNRRVAFVNAILAKIRAVPGVIRAGAISDIPLTSIGGTSNYRFSDQSLDESGNQDALYRVVTRDYFPTVGARLREGRFFESSDRQSKQPVAIVNETLADRKFGGRSALSAKFQYGRNTPDSYWYTIVGVVKEIRERGVAEDLKPAVYIVNEQADQSWPQPTGMVIRTSVEPLSVVPGVREAIWSVDKNEPIARIRTLDDIVNLELAEPSQDSALLGAFAGMALMLACVGLYGVLSYAVTQRTNEIGLRMALGATSSDILLKFGGRGLSLAGAGLGIGLVLAFVAARLMNSLLFGFTPHYALAAGSAAAMLLAVSAFASFFPARRASRVDPLVALRHD